MIQAAGIDLGGTKIEASVFDADWQAVETRRVPTPTNYDALITALVEQVNWVHRHGATLPIGLGAPGRHDAKSGLAFMANVVADGKPLRTDLTAETGCKISFGNDCDLFALSEAILGSGKPFNTVFGLVLGTGIGGGTCFDGHLHQTQNGTAGEVGHMPISANLVAQHDLPILPCGCGRVGCYETLGAGPGISRLAKKIIGGSLPAPEIASSDDPLAQRVMRIWAAIIGELISILQVTIDPECIVLGGGLSNIEGVAALLSDAVIQTGLRGSTPPNIITAAFGDSSGTRGAALLAFAEKAQT